MLNIELFAGVFEFMHSQFHLIHKRIHLSPILVVNIRNVYPALLQQCSLIPLRPCIALTIALLPKPTTYLFFVFYLICHFGIQSITPFFPFTDFILHSIIQAIHLWLQQFKLIVRGISQLHDLFKCILKLRAIRTLIQIYFFLHWALLNGLHQDPKFVLVFIRVKLELFQLIEYADHSRLIRIFLDRVITATDLIGFWCNCGLSFLVSRLRIVISIILTKFRNCAFHHFALGPW